MLFKTDEELANFINLHHTSWGENRAEFEPYKSIEMVRAARTVFETTPAVRGINYTGVLWDDLHCTEVYTLITLEYNTVAKMWRYTERVNHGEEQS